MDSKIKTKTIPHRATPIKKQDNNFPYYPQHDLEATPPIVPMTLKRHINNLPKWKKTSHSKRSRIKNQRIINRSNSRKARHHNRFQWK